MTKHTVTVFLYELRRNLGRKGYLFMTFGIPLIAFALLLGYQFITQQTGAGAGSQAAEDPTQSLVEQLNFESAKHAGYVDLSGMFQKVGSLSSVLTRYPDEAAALAALEQGEIPLYYVIASDYLKTGEVTLVQPKLNISQIETGPVQRLILNTLSEGVDPQVFQRLINPSNLQETNLSLVSAESGAQNEDTSFVIVYVFAIALMMGLFTTNGYLMQSVIEEKETRLIEILLSSLRPFELLAGKILALGLLGLLQMTVWVGSIFLLARISRLDAVASTALALFADFTLPPALLPLLIVYFVLSYLVFASLYSIVGALSNSMREGPQYAAFFTLPAVAPLWFLQVFVTTPNDPLPVALSLFPLTAPIAMIQRLVITSVPAWQIVVSVVLLALTVVATMWLAGRLFRVQTLLAGQPPRLRDLPRLVRG